MLFFTGDTHGERGRFSEVRMSGESAWTSEDTIFVSGDFAYVMRMDEKEKAYLDELAKKPYTICFCDGNHENFTALNGYPVEEWKGGLVHKVRDNIIHLMRGQIYCIQGKKIFVMGGAYSTDKATKKGQGLHWEEELPTETEYLTAIDNLKKNDYQVDYILSHTAPDWVIRRYIGKTPDEHDKKLTNFLDWVMYETKFKKWYFGHWHLDCEWEERYRCLWYDVVRAE